MADEDSGPGASGRDPGRPVGRILRQRRESLRLTGNALASLAGMTQAKVSRIETGRTGAAPEDVRRLAEALRMPPAEIDDLVRRAAGGRTTSVPMTQWRPEESGLARRQVEVARAELAAHEIWTFQPAVVPGLMQTSGYAEAVMRPQRRRTGRAAPEVPEVDLLDGVAARLRRQRILKLPDKRFRFLMTEATLSNRLGSPEDMLAQLRRIREIAGQPNVSVGIIPADAALTQAPMNGFELLDDTWVMMDLFNTALSSRVVSDIELHRDVFEGFAEVAVTEIEPILDRYSRLYRDRSAAG
ncbi:helix-turn-helix transcriptional regulator [Actinoplanes sp. DH11]|uniref:helix-turn-helix domain-containing protein n=1 Tax=Actinoplanes sp. DH11 TaxID=2857011 RepID=UPI001E341867|nr:helix-turn-helix transcriptional regulator [Actinoplanes sp. DH11]